MKALILLVILVLSLSSCQSQTIDSRNRIVGGPCEGCEAVLEFGVRNLSNVDTLPDFHTADNKLKVSGVIYESDGKTPSVNTLLYIYHTNSHGLYEKKGDEKGWARRHGYIQGWIKTDKDGRYEFYTFRPAAYPSGSEPEHIHMTIKETDKNAYYIDAIMFSDDKLLTDKVQAKLTKRGGSGLTTPVYENSILVVERDIVLGLNIPNYDKNE